MDGKESLEMFNNYCISTFPYKAHVHVIHPNKKNNSLKTSNLETSAIRAKENTRSDKMDLNEKLSSTSAVVIGS